jgi:hypothetical protein
LDLRHRVGLIGRVSAPSSPTGADDGGPTQPSGGRVDYRFSGPFVVRLVGAGLVVVGLVLVVLVVLMAVASLPVGWLGVPALLAAVVAAAALVLRLLVVVRLDGEGYRVRYVRGAGVRQAVWADVEDAAAVLVAGERCVRLHLRDGRTTTVPVGLLEGRPDDFVRVLQRRLDRGHGYRPLT